MYSYEFHVLSLSVIRGRALETLLDWQRFRLQVEAPESMSQGGRFTVHEINGHKTNKESHHWYYPVGASLIPPAEI